MNLKKTASDFTANLELLQRFCSTFPVVMDAVDRRRVVNKRDREAISAGRPGDQLVNFGQYSDITWHELLHSEDAKNYVDEYLLKTKPYPGSRMESLVNWIKTQKGKQMHLLYTNFSIYHTGF